MLSREETNTNFIVFGLTRQWLELTIYLTWSEHANHYATDGSGMKYIKVMGIEMPYKKKLYFISKRVLKGTQNLKSCIFERYNIGFHPNLMHFFFFELIVQIVFLKVCWLISSISYGFGNELNRKEPKNGNFYELLTTANFAILFGLLLLKILFGFPIFWLWVYLIKVIQETCLTQ
jgi:hypothetical protein